MSSSSRSGPSPPSSPSGRTARARSGARSLARCRTSSSRSRIGPCSSCRTRGQQMPASMAAETETERRVASSGTPDVRLEGVTKQFDDVIAVDEVSLEIQPGHFFALLGPSGCGKTTTLRMIGGFGGPPGGPVYLGARAVTGLPPYKRDVNTVFQSYALFPHLSIF